MRIRFTVLAALVLGLAFAVPAIAAPKLEPAPPTATPEATLVLLVNRQRTARALPPVRAVEGLAKAARLHSADMLNRDYFAHETLGSSAGFDRRIRRFASARVVGETIAWGSGSLGTPAAIVAMWMKSPPHRAILLDKGFVRVGVGRVVGAFQGQSDAVIWTADFASAR